MSGFLSVKAEGIWCLQCTKARQTLQCRQLVQAQAQPVPLQCWMSPRCHKLRQRLFQLCQLAQSTA